MEGSRAPRVAVFMKHYKVCPPPLHVYLDFSPMLFWSLLVIETLLSAAGPTLGLKLNGAQRSPSFISLGSSCPS